MVDGGVNTIQRSLVNVKLLRWVDQKEGVGIYVKNVMRMCVDRTEFNEALSK